MNIKTSSGIACCRFNDKKNRYEIVMVQKRFTYAFAMFVFGHYSMRSNKNISSLISDMTIQERLDILSLNFDIIWFKVWCSIPRKDNSHNDEKEWMDVYRKATFIDYINRLDISKYNFYVKSKRKFEMLISDKGVRLEKIINSNVAPPKKLLWEIPKGRKNGDESNLVCAIREFYEETSVRIEDHNIVKNVPPLVETHKHNGIVYRNIYYPAFFQSANPRIDINNITQVTELGDVRWIGIEELNYICDNARIINTVTRVIKILKSRLKSKKHF